MVNFRYAELKEYLNQNSYRNRDSNRDAFQEACFENFKIYESLLEIMNKKCEKIEQDIQAEIDTLMKRHDVKETENTTYEDGETRELKRKKQIGPRWPAAPVSECWMLTEKYRQEVSS